MDKTELRSAIEELNAAYVEAIDDDRLEEWPSFFARECVYKIIPRENYDRGLPMTIMYCDTQGMLQDRVVAHRRANIFPPHYTRHLISNVRVKSADGDVVSAQASYVVLQTRHGGDATVYNAGKYVDQIVFEDGQPKFRERTVVCDSFRIATLLVTPI
jgi:anthranilate 1,2-dioxygenase small subunit